MDNTLKLHVMFEMVDQITKPLKNLLAGNQDLAKSLKTTRDRLKELKRAQQDVSEYQKMRAALGKTATTLKSANQGMQELSRQIQAMDAPTQKMQRNFRAASNAVLKLNDQQRTQTASLNELRERMQSAGRGAQTLTEYEHSLKSSIDQTNTSIDTQQAKLNTLASREKQAATARQNMQTMQGVAANMASGGHAARDAGMHVLDSLSETLSESKKFEVDAMRIKALGLGDLAKADAVKYAKAMRVYGTSTTDNITLMRDAMTIFGDEQHAKMVMPTLAKMKFANEAMFGAKDGHANEEKFMNMLKVIELRGGTKNRAAFESEANMVQKVITATGGRVGGDEWRNFIQTGGVAAKQMRKDAFYYQMEPLIQEMGGHAVGTGLMAAYQNVYQGKTTVKAAQELMNLGLLSKNGVSYNKIGQVNHFKTGALAGGDLFKASPLEWMEQVLLPKMAAKGITDPDKIKDLMATIFTNKTAANLFTTMFLQRTQIHKNEHLDAGVAGIDDASSAGRILTQGKEIEALAKLRDLKRELGEKITPLYNAGLQATAAAIEKIVGLMKEHGTAAKAIVITIGALSALSVVLGSLAIALAGVLAPLAVLKFSLKMLSIEGTILARTLKLCATAWRVFVAAAQFASRAMLTTPIGAAVAIGVALLVAGALLIYKYWQPIQAFFKGVFDGISAALAPLGAAFQSVFGALKPLLMPVIQALSSLWQWFTKLIEPVNSTAEELKTATNCGRSFGTAVGDGLRFALLPLELLMRGVALLGGLIDTFFGEAREAFQGGLTSISTLILNWSPLGLFYRAFASVLSWFGITLPAKFSEFGAKLLMGLVNGIMSSLSAVKTAIGLVAGSTVRWFKDKLGIHSPSVVSLIKPKVPIDTRAPLTTISTRGNVPNLAAPTAINIYPAPGADPAAIAQAVRTELDRRDRTQQTRVGSRLSDSVN